MSYTKRIVKGSTLIFAMYFIGGALGYLLRLFLARALTIEDYGLFYAVLSFVGLLSIVRDPGFSTTLTKFVAEFNAKKDKVSVKTTIVIIIALEFIIALLVFFAILGFSGYLSASYFKTPTSVTPLILIMVSYIAGAFVTLQYVFQGLEKIKYYSIIEPLRNILTLFFVVLLIGMGVIGVALGYMIGSVILSIIILILLVRTFPLFKVKAEITKDFTKRIILFSLPVFFTGVGGTILGYTDTLVITYFLSVKDVAFYQAAYPTSQLLWVLASSVSIVLFPIVTELWTKGEKNILAEIISLLTKFLFILIIPAVILVMAFPDVIIRTLFGNAFLPAAAALQILVLSSLFYPIFSMASSSLVGIGKPFINMKVIGGMALANLILNIVLVPLIGITGAAITTTLSYIAGTLLSLYYLKKNLGFKIYPADTLKAFVGGILALCLILLIKSTLSFNLWIEITVSVIIGILFYIVFIVVTRAVKKEEIKLLQSSGIPVPKFILKAIDKLYSFT